MRPDIAIEGLLFYKAAPQKRSYVMTTLGLTSTELEAALVALRERLAQGAIRLVETSDHLALMTASEIAPFITNLRRDELRSDIGKAGLETLAIILYREPISRAEIDRIRGVNSTFALRTLLLRGLIERAPGPGGSQLYTTTSALYAHLGITKKHELPQYSTFATALDLFENTAEPESAAPTYEQ
jgi:segregation and condensation protein B